VGDLGGWGLAGTAFLPGLLSCLFFFVFGLGAGDGLGAAGIGVMRMGMDGRRGTIRM